MTKLPVENPRKGRSLEGSFFCGPSGSISEGNCDSDGKLRCFEGRKNLDGWIGLETTHFEK